MEIQSKTTNVTQTNSNNVLYNNQNSQNTKTASSFLSSVQNNENTNSVNEDVELSFQKINTMTLDDIENIYQDNEQASLLKTLKLSTLFSTNINMNEAIFNAVLGQNDVSSSQMYLYTMMSNRNTYLSNSNDGGAWLRQSLISQLDGEVQAEQIKIEKEFLYSMVQFEVAQHMSDMMNFSKKGRDDNKDNYGLFSLYDNTYLKYQSLYNEYEALESGNKNLLNQQLNSAKLMALSF